MVLLATALTTALVAPPPEPDIPPAGDRWRFSWAMHLEGFVSSATEDVVTTLGMFFGAGFPVRQHGPPGFEQSHAVGYWPSIGTGFNHALIHRHRFGLAGIITRPRRHANRKIGLFYQGGVGTAVYWAAPSGSIEGRIGLALGHHGRPAYLMTVGGDVDFRPGAMWDGAPFTSVSTLTVSFLGVAIL